MDSLSLVCALVGLLLSLITLVQSKGQSLVSWALLLYGLTLTLGFWQRVL